MQLKRFGQIVSLNSAKLFIMPDIELGCMLLHLGTMIKSPLLPSPPTARTGLLNTTPLALTRGTTLSGSTARRAR